jgi:hypothetical protein
MSNENERFGRAVNSSANHSANQFAMFETTTTNKKKIVPHVDTTRDTTTNVVSKAAAAQVNDGTTTAVTKGNDIEPHVASASATTSSFRKSAQLSVGNNDQEHGAERLDRNK